MFFDERMIHSWGQHGFRDSRSPTATFTHIGWLKVLIELSGVDDTVSGMNLRNATCIIASVNLDSSQSSLSSYKTRPDNNKKEI